MSPSDRDRPKTCQADGAPIGSRRRYLGALTTGLTAGVAGCVDARLARGARAELPKRASKRASSSNPTSVHHFVRKAGEPDDPFDPPPLAPKPDSSDLLAERRAGNPVDDGTEVGALDGDLGQLTWERFSAVEGDVDVKCLREGTHVSLHLRNLVPKALYTAWSVVFAEDDDGQGFIDDRDLGVAFQNLAGFGPLGPPDGSENTFRASGGGEGQSTTIQPGGPLGAAGTIEDCALEEFEWHVVVGFHLDGETHGSQFDDPESPGAAVEQAAFVFENGTESEQPLE